MYCIIPVSVNECNLREAYAIAPTEVRRRGNVHVREKPRYRKQSTGCDTLSIDLIHD
jgi:hypothetical protein